MWVNMWVGRTLIFQKVRKLLILLVAGACFEAIHNALAAWLVRRWVLPKNGRRTNRN
jgi:hypothetical protein